MERASRWRPSRSTSSGPFTVTVSNLPFGSGGLTARRSKAHLPTSAPFRARPPGLVSGQLSPAADGGAAMSPWFPVAFRPPAFASWASCSRRGIPLPSRSAYQAAAPGPRRGFHVPHIRVTAGLGALFTPRPAVLTRPVRSLRPPLAASSRGQALSPRSSIPSPGLSITRRHQGFTHVHPPGLPPRLWSPDGTRALGLAPRASHPNRQDLRRTPGRGTGIEHSPGATRPTSSDLQSMSSLAMCDLVSHDRAGHDPLPHRRAPGLLGAVRPRGQAVRREEQGPRSDRTRQPLPRPGCSARPPSVPHAPTPSSVNATGASPVDGGRRRPSSRSAGPCW